MSTDDWLPKQPKPLAPTRARFPKKIQTGYDESELMYLPIMYMSSCPEGRCNDPIVELKDIPTTHRKKNSRGPIMFGNWSREEDEIIISWVKNNGDRTWSELVSRLPHRTGKQCRERWKHHLDPTVNRTDFTPEEDELIVQSVRLMGHKWTRISHMLPGRTDNAVKNRWYSTLRRRADVIGQENEFNVWCKTKSPSSASPNQVSDPESQKSNQTEELSTDLQMPMGIMWGVDLSDRIDYGEYGCPDPQLRNSPDNCDSQFELTGTLDDSWRGNLSYDLM